MFKFAIDLFLFLILAAAVVAGSLGALALYDLRKGHAPKGKVR